MCGIFHTKRKTMRYFLLYSSLCIVLLCAIILVRNNWAQLTDFKMAEKPPFYTVETEKPQGVCGGVTGNYQTIPYNSIGKSLFLQQCACCHNPNMKARSTGPALAGVSQRWGGREKLLYRFIRNGEKVRKTGDAYVNALYNEYGQIPHIIFPKLTDAEIDEILNFIQSRQ